jgi:hypothetical protein
MKFGVYWLSTLYARTKILPSVVNGSKTIYYSMGRSQGRVLTIIFLPTRQVITGSGKEVHDKLQ